MFQIIIFLKQVMLNIFMTGNRELWFMGVSCLQHAAQNISSPFVSIKINIKSHIFLLPAVVHNIV